MCTINQLVEARPGQAEYRGAAVHALEINQKQKHGRCCLFETRQCCLLSILFCFPCCCYVIFSACVPMLSCVFSPLFFFVSVLVCVFFCKRNKTFVKETCLLFLAFFSCCSYVSTCLLVLLLLLLLLLLLPLLLLLCLLYTSDAADE